MAGEPQGLAHFPGVDQIVAADFSLVHGISPSACILTIAPQNNFIGIGGELTFTYGMTSITFSGCKIDRCSMQRDQRGLVWQLSIMDRRWKWTGNGQISGRYNSRWADGSIASGSEKTPSELFELLFEALLETNYDIADVPNDLRPVVEWNVARPAEAMAALCDELGLRVVLDIDDKIYIRKAGIGAELPLDYVIDNSLTIDPPEMPDKIAIVTGGNWYQVDFELEAVAEEECGTIVPIDDVSYKPSDGWANADFPELLSVAEEYRERAKAWVFKAYRVKTPVDIPGIEDEDQFLLEDILPIGDEQCEAAIDQCAENEEADEPVQKGRKPAQVYGIYHGGKYAFKNNATTMRPLESDAMLEYKGRFNIDRDRGLVIFDDLNYKNDNDDGSADVNSLSRVEAELRLRAAVTVQHQETLATIRSRVERNLGVDFGTPTRVQVHDELIVRFIPTYGSDFSVESVSDNFDSEISEACEHYLDGMEAEFQVSNPQTVVYAGLKAVNLDGAIAQWTVSISGAGTLTSVSRNTEQLNWVIPYSERRMLEKARAFRDLAEKSKPSNIARAAKQGK